jgi:hypothetical protein
MEIAILEYREGWTVEDKRNAMVHVKVFESFEFIYALVTLQCSRLYLKEAALISKERHKILLLVCISFSNAMRN